MSIYFDKTRNKYMVRVTIDGKRTFIGRYEDADIARVVDLANSPSALEVHRIDFIEEDVSILWLGAFREWRAKLKKSREAKKNDKVKTL